MSSDKRAGAGALSRVHFVTYGSGAFARSAKLLAAEARAFGISNVHLHGPKTLPHEFVRGHRDFLIRSAGRGDGYWLWKSYIVQELLSRLQDDDILIYADAGCAINIAAKARFREWIDFCDAEGVLSFQMDHLEKHWTKMSVARFMHADAPKFMETGQILAGIFGVRKTSATRQLLRRWYDICALEWTIDDSVQPVQNAEGFCEHRHDQSIFSLLIKQAGHASLADETYPKGGDWSATAIAQVPIVARRRQGKKMPGVLDRLTPGTLAQRAKRVG